MALKLLFQDYETYFGPAKKPDGSPLSLSLRNPKLSMTEYVRHPESEVLGCSLWFDQMKEPQWFRHDELKGVYKDINWKEYRVVAHNCLFEALINYEWYRVVPGGYFCTMALVEAIFQGGLARGLDNVARKLGLGEKLPDLLSFKGMHAKDFTPENWVTMGLYANNDTWLAAKVFQLLAPLLPQMEWDLMSNTLMMFGDPLLRVDVPLAREALAEAVEERRVALLKPKIVDKDGKPFADKTDKKGRTITSLEQIEDEISGNISFAAHLEKALGEPVPMKWSEKQEKMIPAFSKTDGGFIALKSHKSEEVRNLVNARLMVKGTLPITRAQRLIDIGTTGSCQLNVCLHFARAHTLRDSGGNKMNLQNLKRGSKLREAIIAPPGHVLLAIDSRQIEPRWLTTGVRQMDIVEIFKDPKGDPYSYQASGAYGYTVTKKTHPIERQVGKVMQLSLGYQTGAAKLFNTLNIKEGIPVTFEFAQQVVTAFRAQNDKISGHWKMWDKEWLPHLVFGTKKLEIMDGLMTLDPLEKRIIFPNGLYLKYPGLECDEGQYRYWRMKGEKKREWVYVYGGAMTENWVQTVSRHTVFGQVWEISKRYRNALREHDAGLFVVPEKEADEAQAFAMAEFRKVPWWAPKDLPLDAESGYDVCYSK